MNDGELYQAVIRQAIDDVVEVIRNGELEEKEDSYHWLFESDDKESSLYSFLELFPGEITIDIMRDLIWEEIDRKCKYRISPLSLSFFVEKGSDYVSEPKASIKDIAPVEEKKESKKKNDLRMTLVEQMIERTKLGDIEWAKELNGDSITFSAYYHADNRTYVFVASRTPIDLKVKTKDLKRKYNYKLEIDIIINDKNADKYDIQRGIGRLFKFLIGASGDEQIALQQAIEDLKV